MVHRGLVIGARRINHEEKGLRVGEIGLEYHFGHCAGGLRRGGMLIEFYDLLIFAPLWLDRQVRAGFGSHRRESEVHRGVAPEIKEMPS